jgi:hypothetical protein
MSEIEVVITNYMRPFNIPDIVKALRSQTVKCTITVVDAGSQSSHLKSNLQGIVDRYYTINHNYGPSNRYLFIDSYDHPFTLFIDDDYLPGSKMLEYFLTFKTIQNFGVLGQVGRLLFSDGKYDNQDITRNDCLREVDVLVRGYFLRTEVLQLFKSFVVNNRLNWQDLEDDITLCASLKIAGLKNLLLPISKKETLLILKELPAPNAWWQRPQHLTKRNHFCSSLIKLGWKYQRQYNSPCLP